jgi:ATP/maltotriose-dependent transcriptional regulator MalT
MITAADDPESALAIVRQAEEALGPSDACRFCTVMIAVPSAIACAHAGEFEEAHRYLESAQQSCANWIGTAWPAAVSEARAHVAAAEGDTDQGAQYFDEAAALFTRAGQPRAAARCERGLSSLQARPT